jgi:hypothetical protein
MKLLWGFINSIKVIKEAKYDASGASGRITSLNKVV